MAKTESKKEKAVHATPAAKAAPGATGHKGKQHAKKDRVVLKKILLIKRKHLPTFRGRFGVKSIRRKSIEKWQKWRKSRGKDIKRNQEDGARPDSGYRTMKEIRFLHPSGYREVLVRNKAGLSGLKDCVVRIASGIGAKKRKEMIAEAKKVNLKVVN